MDLTKLKQSIIRFEGLKLKPYKCPADKLSIGYGRNLEDNGITINEAIFMLENDLLNIKLELEDKLPVFNQLDDVRQNVLIEMAYNMGVPKLLGFKNTIDYLEVAIFSLNNGDFGVAKSHFLFASEEMLNSKWHEQHKEYDLIDGKANNNGLLRSEYLSKLMKEGKY
ncbi:glycoside hydrolase family protein [Arcobacter aquimarinus]|uniref:Lysozyme n=1 Tax=Arcobacter aquimarinus TaxID=1315211 RepID=A0AAE7B4W8_9BACT|nr:lysozyme [Arcobacter aquimarinus]QKE26055.1 putative phage-related lysozyme [Arcobacter aquimarinus]